MIPPRAASTPPSNRPPVDLELARKLEEQQRHMQEYDIAVRREELLDKQRAAQDKLRHPTSSGGAAGGFVQPNGDPVTAENILDVVDAPPPIPQPRVPTPAERTRRTLRMFEERAKAPDTSFEKIYRPPTNFTLFHEKSKRREDYDTVDVRRTPPIPSGRCSSSITPPPALQQNAVPSCSSVVDALNGPQALKQEVKDFEYRQAITEAEEAEYCEEVRTLIHCAKIPPPPKLILMLFRFGNVRNLDITKKLREVGYPVIHEQFSSASDRGCITRQSFVNVMQRYAGPKEMNDAIKLLNCFDKSTTGDVELNHFLLGMQILLKCASAGDTLKYCFSLMDTNSRVPRYVTRFEVQSLLTSALSVRREKQAEMLRLGLQAQVEDEEGDKEFDIMARAIHELMDESWRYDYMGRIGLKEFLGLLREKVHEWKDAIWDQSRCSSPRGGSSRTKPAVLFDSMGLDQGWQQQPCVAAAHRMSSKKMLYSSLQYIPSNALKDPHRIPAPMPSLVEQNSFRTTMSMASLRSRVRKERKS